MNKYIAQFRELKKSAEIQHMAYAVEDNETGAAAREEAEDFFALLNAAQEKADRLRNERTTRFYWEKHQETLEEMFPFATIHYDLENKITIEFNL